MGRSFHWGACTLAFGAGLLCASLAIQRLFPGWGMVDELAIRLAAFTPELDQVTALFLGSSRVQHQIIPPLFDRLAVAGGQPVRSFNLGIDGMMAPEDSYFLEQVAALKPPHLRWVFVELSFIPPYTSRGDDESARMIYWRDAPRSGLLAQQDLLREVRKARSKKPPRWWSRCLAARPFYARQLRPWVKRVTSLGGGAVRLQEWLAGEEASRRERETAQEQETAGYLAPPAHGVPAILDRAYAELQRGPADPLPLEPPAQKNLERLLAQIRRLGAEPVIFSTPAISPIAFHPEDGTAARFLDFCDPQRWPDLYERTYRLDVGHLNAAGAELFTRRLAEEWLKTAP